MKHIYVQLVVSVCILSSLNAKNNGELSEILKKSGEGKISLKPIPDKPKNVKSSDFIFKDNYEDNLKRIQQDKDIKCVSKSKRFEYENKSNFKFQFAPGSGQNNLVGRQGTSGSGGSGRGKGR